MTRSVHFSFLFVTLSLTGGPVHSGDMSDWYTLLQRLDPYTGLYLSCCDEHDAVYADHWTIDEEGHLVVTITGGGPRHHPWAPIGRSYTIPSELVINPVRNPTGHSMLFLNPASLEAICFVFGDGS